MSDLKPPQFTFEMKDEMEKGAYANLGVISFRDTEMNFDFFYMQPQAQKAKAVARVVTSLLHAKRFLSALADNIARYEAVYGKIQDQNPPRFDGPSMPGMQS